MMLVGYDVLWMGMCHIGHSVGAAYIHEPGVIANALIMEESGEFSSNERLSGTVTTAVGIPPAASSGIR